MLRPSWLGALAERGIFADPRILPRVILVAELRTPLWLSKKFPLGDRSVSNFSPIGRILRWLLTPCPWSDLQPREMKHRSVALPERDCDVSAKLF